MYYLGLDLGQAQDYTALAVVEKLKANSVSLHHVRHLQRFNLGTSYPEIIRQVKALAETPQLAGRFTLIADATGVGKPVVDLLKAAKISTVPVYITGGYEEKHDGAEGWHVPKRHLVSMLQVLLGSGRLKLAASLSDVQALVDELVNFRVKVSQAGNDSYEAWRERDHDDLVLALALAVWYSERFGIAGFLNTERKRSPIADVKGL